MPRSRSIAAARAGVLVSAPQKSPVATGAPVASSSPTPHAPSRGHDRDQRPGEREVESLAPEEVEEHRSRLQADDVDEEDQAEQVDELRQDEVARVDGPEDESDEQHGRDAEREPSDADRAEKPPEPDHREEQGDGGGGEQVVKAGEQGGASSGTGPSGYGSASRGGSARPPPRCFAGGSAVSAPRDAPTP